MVKITDIYLQEDSGPVMGAGEIDGERVVWKALYEGRSYNWWKLSEEEWEVVDRQPASKKDEAELEAIYRIHGMDQRSPFKPYFLHDDADWSAVA